MKIRSSDEKKIYTAKRFLNLVFKRDKCGAKFKATYMYFETNSPGKYL